MWHLGDPSTPPRDQTPDPVTLVWWAKSAVSLLVHQQSPHHSPFIKKITLPHGRRCYGIFILNRKMSLSQTVNALAL